MAFLSPRHGVLPVTGALFLVAVAGCGGHGQGPHTPMSAGDLAVCNAAHIHNARIVYATRANITDPQLKKTAESLYPGAPHTIQALDHLTSRCATLGYANPTSSSP